MRKELAFQLDKNFLPPLFFIFFRQRTTQQTTDDPKPQPLTRVWQKSGVLDKLNISASKSQSHFYSLFSVI